MSEDPQDEAMNSHSEEEEDDEDMEEDAELEKKLSELDGRLEASANQDYDAHVAKVDLLRQSGELDKLREAREAFHSAYPLTPALWKAWIEDETRMISTVEDKGKVADLYDRAVGDYLSVDLWYEYASFSLGGIGVDPGAEDRVRLVFERALASVGLHCSQGSMIWDSYRIFEKSVNKPDKLEKIFRRQLAVPLINMEATMAEYKEFLEGKPVDPLVEEQYKKALEMLSKREAFEDSLQALDDAEKGLEEQEKDAQKRLQIYSDYLNVEFSEDAGSEPTRVNRLRLMFERRVSDHCLEPHCWIKYIEFADKEFKSGEDLLQVYRRAVRNVPFESKVWLKYIRALEKCDQPIKTIREVFEQAITNNFTEDASRYTDLWIAYIDTYRRKTELYIEDGEGGDKLDEKKVEELRTIFTTAQSFIKSYRGVRAADPECRILKYWAYIEADPLKEMPEARKLWSGVVDLIGDRCKPWLEYAQLEANFGSIKHQRRVYQRGLERVVSEDPEEIAQAWMTFERMEGDLGQVEECESKVQAKLKWWSSRQQNHHQTSPKDNKKTFQNKNRQQQNFAKGHHDKKAAGGFKRKHEDENRHQSDQPSFKKPAKSDNQPKGEVFKAPVAPPPGFQPPGGKKVVKPPPGFNSESSKVVKPPPGFNSESSKVVRPPPGFSAESNASGDNKPGSDEEKSRRVFLSNLDFSVTEEEVRNAFEEAGLASASIESVSLVKNYAGKSKGFGYLALTDVGAAEKALGMDRKVHIKKRPLFVSPYGATKGAGAVASNEGGEKKSALKFSTGVEKNKLFVRNIGFEATQEELEELFKSHSGLREVRLVTYRNGHSKGVAYVEFETEEAASKALMATDGSDFKGRQLSVEISRPPPRKPGGPTPQSGPSLGSGLSEGSRGKGRSQLSFVPRAVASSSSSSTSNGSNGATQKSEGAPKSNADFRSMLLGKK